MYGIKNQKIVTTIDGIYFQLSSKQVVGGGREG